MPRYMVLVQRVRTIRETSVVHVNCSSEQYADRDARAVAAGLPCERWLVDLMPRVEVTVEHIRELRDDD